MQQTVQKKTRKKQNPLRPKIPIIILLHRRLVHLMFLLRRLRAQHMYRVLIRRVDIRLGRRYGNFDFVLVACCGFDDTEVGADFVVAFGSPGDVAVGVVEVGWRARG